MRNLARRDARAGSNTHTQFILRDNAQKQYSVHSLGGNAKMQRPVHPLRTMLMSGAATQQGAVFMPKCTICYGATP